MMNQSSTPGRRNDLRLFRLSMLEVPGVLHAFGSRDTGTGAGVARRRIKNAFPEIEELCTIKQVHGSRVVEARSAGDARGLRNTHADAIVSNAKGLALCVRTADCVPVLVLDPRGKATAAVHAGWKGTAARVAAEAVKTMQRLYGSEPASLRAGIGPCICPPHYQVDGPVIEAVEKGLGEKSQAVLFPEDENHARLDLVKANRIVLEEAGIPAENIEELGLCTWCRPELFFSYRREGKGVPSLYHFIMIA
ncbi:MAG: peptidoglycan editing factor PgeF [bacterium]